MKKSVSVSEKKYWLWYQNWTLVSVPNTETWFRAHTTLMSFKFCMYYLPLFVEHEVKVQTRDYRCMKGVHQKGPKSSSNLKSYQLRLWMVILDLYGLGAVHKRRRTFFRVFWPPLPPYRTISYFWWPLPKKDVVILKILDPPPKKKKWKWKKLRKKKSFLNFFFAWCTILQKIICPNVN